MASWPGTLPQSPLLESYQETAPNGLLRTQMEAGPAKVRRRFTAAPRPFKFRVDLTTAQVGTLDAFFLTTCAMGALAFDWLHPRTGASVSYRFVSPPAYTPADGDVWKADLDLEIMP